MKKFLNKTIGAVLALVLLLGIAIPVHAREHSEIPSSFEFLAHGEIELSLNYYDELFSSEQAIIDMLNGFAADIRGTVIAEYESLFMYMELDVNVPTIGLPMTFRLWVDVDVTDMNDPIAKVIVEIPSMLRLMLFALAPELNRQYFVLDLSAYLNILDYVAFELDGFSMSQYNELIADFNIEMETIWADIMEELRLLWEEIQADEYVQASIIVNSPSENRDSQGNIISRNAGFRLQLSFDNGFDSGDFMVTAAADMHNINTAQRVPVPTTTSANSFDVLAWLTELFMFDYGWLDL